MGVINSKDEGSVVSNNRPETPVHKNNHNSDAIDFTDWLTRLPQNAQHGTKASVRDCLTRTTSYGREVQLAAMYYVKQSDGTLLRQTVGTPVVTVLKEKSKSSFLMRKEKAEETARLKKGCESPDSPKTPITVMSPPNTHGTTL